MGSLKVVVDEGVPRHLVKALREAGFDAHRFKKGWEQPKNGILIAAVEAEGFAVLVTNDKNIAHQQSLQGRSIAVVALPLNRRSAIMARGDDIVDTIRRARPGQHVVIGLDGTCKVKTVMGEETIEQDLPSVPSFKG